MERALSDYEKLKRAEEIYNRRRMNNTSGVRVYSNSSQEKSSKKEVNNVKKLVLQICICIVLYFIIYLIQNSNYIFSEQFINKTKEILNYDIDLKKYATQVVDEIKSGIEWLNNSFSKKEDVPEEKVENNENVDEENINEENSSDRNSIENDNEIPINEETNVENNSTTSEIGAVGSGEIENIDEINGVELQEDNENLSQMEIDARSVKEKYAMESPLNASITSPYGERNVAPKFHLGVDLGANTGTEIATAMSGTATTVSSIGDYGKHICITSEDGDLITLYAHCSELCVQEGQNVNVGDIIAKVGETGNATGPHLHFEVIYKRSLY